MGHFYSILQHKLHFYISAARLHFYSPELRFFQPTQNHSNPLNHSAGTAANLSSQNYERRMANNDECVDVHLTSQLSHVHHQLPTPFPHHHLYQPDKQQKSEDLQRNDALTTLMNGKRMFRNDCACFNNFLYA
jgi:hypothetical protein